MSEQYQINLFQGRDLVVVSKEGAREIKMTIRQAAAALVSHEALVAALEEATLRMEALGQDTSQQRAALAAAKE